MSLDMDEAEDMVRAHDGFENDPHGRVLIRGLRSIRRLITEVRALEQRVRALEGKR